jgi:hypothetical protein
MNNIFSNLALRNSGLPSPEVLQPRLPTLFDPASIMAEQTESLFEQPMPSLNSAATSDETGHTPSIHLDLESSLPGEMPIQDASPDNLIQHQLLADRPLQSRDETPAREITILPSDLPRQQKSINFSSTMTPPDELKNNISQSETGLRYSERTPVRKYKNDSPGKKVSIEDRIVHPRVEILAASKTEENNQSSRPAPGGGEKSMKHVLPHEEPDQAEAPVVRIHIGRIEVRAVAPAPAQSSSKSTPAQPRLTLDDYLRQREGRR